MKTPKRMGPGMEPTHLKIMLCKPKAKLLSSSLTALKDATTLGMVAKNVRKTPMNWTMMKGMRSPQSLEQVLRSAEPPSIQPHSVKLFGEVETKQLARHGERYINPSDPHTGS